MDNGRELIVEYHQLIRVFHGKDDMVASRNPRPPTRTARERELMR